jgi:hypothetical protein
MTYRYHQSANDLRPRTLLPVIGASRTAGSATAATWDGALPMMSGSSRGAPRPAAFHRYRFVRKRRRGIAVKPVGGACHRFRRQPRDHHRAHGVDHRRSV